MPYSIYCCLVYQMFTLYTLNIYNYICEKKKRQPQKKKCFNESLKDRDFKNVTGGCFKSKNIVII